MKTDYFDFGKQCCFCGADNRHGAFGYAGERTCDKCGKGGYGEPDEPQMAYKTAYKNRHSSDFQRWADDGGRES